MNLCLLVGILSRLQIPQPRICPGAISLQIFYDHRNLGRFRINEPRNERLGITFVAVHIDCVPDLQTDQHGGQHQHRRQCPAKRMEPIGGLHHLLLWCGPVAMPCQH